MEFNKLVKERLLPILQKEGFVIVEEFINIVRFESSIIKLNLVFNEYEKSNFIEIGERYGQLYPLNNRVIRNIFNSELEIEQVPMDIFINNLSTIFQQKQGIEVLKGNVRCLIEFIEQDCSDYTFKLIQKQILESAAKAWENNDYKSFIEYIEKIGVDKSPRSFQLKYEIAIQKL